MSLLLNPSVVLIVIFGVCANKTKNNRGMQGWGVAVLVGVPHKDAVFKTNPLNLLNERTLKGTFFGNYKPRSDIPSVVEKYMNKVISP